MNFELILTGFVFSPILIFLSSSDNFEDKLLSSIHPIFPPILALSATLYKLAVFSNPIS